MGEASGQRGDPPEVAAAAALFNAGRAAEAEQALADLRAAGERGFMTLHLSGLLAARRGDLAAADRWLTEAVAAAPANPVALRDHALILRRLGRPQPALTRLTAALELEPSYAAAHTSCANVFNDLRRWREALASAERALALTPQAADAANARGNALAGLGRGPEAIAAYRAAAALAPTYADPRVNLGNLLLAQGAPAEALASYAEAIDVAPALAPAWNGRGNALATLKHWGEAVRAYDRAWALAPTLPYLAGQRLHAKMKICDWRDLDEGLAAVRDALAAGRPPSALLPLLALPLAPEEQLRAAELYTAAEFPASPAAPAPSPAERIRLAYLSADFHDHATAYLMAELFELHDRARFEVIGISFGPAADSPMRQRLRAAFDRFFDVAPLGAAAIADLVRGLGVDVAVDLKGFTAGARAAVFASRVAPVQVNYLGFPGTMGADFMDYLIADPVLIPPSARGHYAEKIAYVGGCYQPNDRRRPEPTITTSRADHGLPAHGLVFGAFNNAYKILPAVFAAWMRLLADVEGSVLWLFVETPESADNLRAEAARHGVDPGRLVFAGMKPLPGHLERHRHMDLFLDTGPYNAHTTASDALWMDVPLVTWAGETFAGRVAASLLTAVGLPELVAPSFAAYEALALDLARDPARLATLKGRLAMGKRASRLFDTPRLARDLERLYAAMHERRLAGQPPDHIPAAD